MKDKILRVTLIFGEELVSISCTSIAKCTTKAGNLLITGCQDFSLEDENGSFNVNMLSFAESSLLYYALGEYEEVEEEVEEDIGRFMGE